MDEEPVPPALEVRLAGVAGRGVAREAGAGDHRAAGAKQQDGRLVADLHAGAGDQGDAATEVGGGARRALVLVAAGRAELVVEAVDVAVLPLAHVAPPGRVELRTSRRARRRRAGAPPRTRAGRATSPRRRCRAGGIGGNGVRKTGSSRRRRIPLARRRASSPSFRASWVLRSIVFWSRLRALRSGRASSPANRCSALPGGGVHRRQQGAVPDDGSEDPRRGLDVGGRGGRRRGRLRRRRVRRRAGRDASRRGRRCDTRLPYPLQRRGG